MSNDTASNETGLHFTTTEEFVALFKGMFDSYDEHEDYIATHNITGLPGDSGKDNYSLILFKDKGNWVEKGGNTHGLSRTSGSIVALLREYFKCDKPTAIEKGYEILRKQKRKKSGNVKQFPAKRRTSEKVKDRAQTPIPEKPEKFPDKPRNRKKAHLSRTYSYAYRDLASAIHFYANRFEQGKEKLFEPYFLSAVSNRWMQFGLPNDQIIPYNLPGIEKAEGVLLVEGEKACDAAIRDVAQAGCDLHPLTWFGGVSSLGRTPKAAWKPLKGKRLVYVHDNDQGGWDSIERVAALMWEIGVTRVQVPQYTDEFGEKWDQADGYPPGWDLNRLLTTLVDVPKPNPDEQIRLQAQSWSESANALQFVAEHAQNVQWTKELKWMVRDGAEWKANDQGAVFCKAQVTAVRLAQQAISGNELTLAQVNRMLSMKAIENMLEIAKHDPRIRRSIEDFDKDPWLLNFPNGTLELKTMRLRAHDRKDMITKVLPVDYEPEAKCPLWIQVLERIFAKDYELIGYWQRVCGYWLTGSDREQVVFVLHGTGANGKSVAMNVVKAAMADYAIGAETKTFMRKGSDTVSNDLRRLSGYRLVITNETNQGQSLDEALIKLFSGGDGITSRALYQEAVDDDKPSAKLAIVGNHKPEIRGTDHGIWRRIHLIPFEVQIPEEEQDRDLAEKLKAEMPGIIAWMVEGVRHYLLEGQDGKGGLNPPEKVLAAGKDYREQSDRVKNWLAEACELDVDASENATELRNAFNHAAKLSGERAMSKNRFAEEMKRLGFEKTLMGKGRTMHYLGIRLRDRPVQQELGSEVKKIPM